MNQQKYATIAGQALVIGWCPVAERQRLCEQDWGVGGSLPHMLTNLYLLFPCPGFSCLASHGYSQTCQSALQALPQLDVAWQFPRDTTRRSNVCGQLEKAGLWKTGTETWRMECGKCLHPWVRTAFGNKDPLSWARSIEHLLSHHRLPRGAQSPG